MSGKIKSANADSVLEAADLLGQGKLVAFPTETVYGLGANALNGKAVARIFEAKGRPNFNPLIVHLKDASSASEYVEMDQRAKKLAAHFWPGPLTMILPRSLNCEISELCSAGLPTLAVRVPSGSTALSLLKSCNFPIAAPSANSSGQLSPTAPKHVNESLGDKVDMILASGSCSVGLESTVLDLSGKTPVILRPGAITDKDIEEVLEEKVTYELEVKNDNPKSPGQLLRHYAPRIALRLNAVDLESNEALLAFGSDKFMGIKGGGSAKDLPDYAHRNLSESGYLEEAASNLFKMLHELDTDKNASIAVMSIPDQGLGIAINDRLKRAAESKK